MQYLIYEEKNNETKSKIEGGRMYKNAINTVKSVDFANNVCTVNNGKDTQMLISDLVSDTLDGQACVSNPDVLKDWPGCEKIEKKSRIDNLDEKKMVKDRCFIEYDLKNVCN